MNGQLLLYEWSHVAGRAWNVNEAQFLVLRNNSALVLSQWGFGSVADIDDGLKDDVTTVQQVYMHELVHES